MKYLAIAFALALAPLASGCDAHGEPTGSTCPQGSTLTYANFGQQFMTNYCTDCHSSTKTGSARHGAPAFHDYDTVEGVRATIDHVDENAAAGPNAVNTLMPEDDPRPTEQERRQLGEWLACGAP